MVWHNYKMRVVALKFIFEMTPLYGVVHLKLIFEPTVCRIKHFLLSTVERLVEYCIVESFPRSITSNVT